MSFIDDVLRTENKDFDGMKGRLNSTELVRLLHGVIGMVTESAEAADMLKKHIFYGKPLDKVNLIEELGDLMYYIALTCSELGVDFEKVQAINTAKLEARYGKVFTETAALNRDLDTERSILEKKD